MSEILLYFRHFFLYSFINFGFYKVSNAHMCFYIENDVSAGVRNTPRMTFFVAYGFDTDVEPLL